MFWWKGSGGKRRKLAWFKMWQTHTAICGKSRGNLGKFSRDLWINSCNWPWELKMWHMFLVPVFETGSPRTFQPSPRTEAARAGEEDAERHKGRREGRGREECQEREIDGRRQKMDGQIGRVWGRAGWNGMGVQRMKDWQRGRKIGERGKRAGEQRCAWPASHCDILTGEAFVLANLCSSQQEKWMQTWRLSAQPTQSTAPLFTAQLHLIWPARAAEKAASFKWSSYDLSDSH